MIADIDETLRRLIVTELAKLPNCPVRDPEQITFDPPAIAEASQDGEARVNLYLLDLRENLERRGEGIQLQRRPEEQRAGQRRTAVYIDLSYLVSVYAGNDPQAEHRLLADVLGVLLRCLAAPPEYLTGALEQFGANIVGIAAAQPDRLASADPASLWQALAAKMKPALSLVVTAPFDPFETKWTRLVREAVIALKNGDQSPGQALDLGRMRVSIAGMVVDENGDSPLPGVTVTAVGQDREVVTDGRGFFYFVNLPAGAHRFRLTREGYLPQETQQPAQEPGQPARSEPMIVRMRPMTDTELAADLKQSAQVNQTIENTMALAGVLRYANGEPAAYVPVRADTRETRTDAKGVYLFTDLGPGEYRLTADLPGHGEIEIEQQGGTAVVGDQAKA